MISKVINDVDFYQIVKFWIDQKLKNYEKWL